MLAKKTHLRFVVQKNGLNSSIIENPKTGETFPYRLLSIPEGDSIILYVADYDPLRDRYALKYSVLNDFKEGETYEFDIVDINEKGLKIEYVGGVYHFVPKSFEQYAENGRIKLKIANINIEENKIFFDPPVRREHFDLSTLDLEEGKSYRFKVEGLRTIDDNIHLFNLTYKGYVGFSVKIYDFQLDESFIGKEIACIVKKIEFEENKIFLNQDLFSLLSGLYEKGKIYTFEILDKNKTMRGDAPEEYYELIDEFGITHLVYNNYFMAEVFENKQPGDEVELYVKDINEKGYLILFSPDALIQKNENFISVEDLFDDIGIDKSRIQELFFDFRPVLNELNEEIFSSLFTDYENKENLWIFSYLSLIDFLIQNEFYPGQKWKEAFTYSEVYLKIEDWILEGSTYLKRFSVEKRKEIIEKSEHKRSLYKKDLLAIRALINNEADDIIENTLEAINRSGYIRTERKDLLLRLLVLNPQVLNKNGREITRIVAALLKENLVATEDIQDIVNILEHKISSTLKEINRRIGNNHHQIGSDDIQAVSSLIQLMAQQLIIIQNLEDYNEDYKIKKTSNILRLASYIVNDGAVRKSFLEGSVKCLICNRYIQIGYTDTDLENLIGKLQHFVGTFVPVSAKSDQVSLLYKNNGAIYTEENAWFLLDAKSALKVHNNRGITLNNAGVFFDGYLNIANPSQIQDLDLADYNLGINDILHNWSRYFTLSDSVPANEKYPEEGTSVTLRCKNFYETSNPEKPIVFFSIVNPEWSGDGIMLSDYIAPFFFGTRIKEVIHPGETVKGKVLNINERGISFSILSDVLAIASQKYPLGSTVQARVVYQNYNSGLYYAVSEDGFVFASNEDLRLNEAYDFQVVKTDEELNVQLVSALGPVSLRYFDFVKMYRKLIETYILVPGNDALPGLPSEIGIKKSVDNIILGIEGLIKLEDNLQAKITYFNLARLLAIIIKSAKSYYFDAIIKFYKLIESIRQGDAETPCYFESEINETTERYFPSLTTVRKLFTVIRHYNKPDDGNLDSLLSFYSDPDYTDFYGLIKLVMANNLLYPGEGQQADALLYEEIKKKMLTFIAGNFAFEKWENIVLDDEEPKEKGQKGRFRNRYTDTRDADDTGGLGRESNMREFKSSVLFSPATHTADENAQMKIIMKTICGFLNANGGTLYIGVNDEGEIEGLQSDYDYWHVNHDGYERKIRAELVKFFHKDVNGQINFNFKKQNNQEYLEINIPQYHEPVSLDNNFFQRQGNETRILKGNDLTAFMKRRLAGVSSELPAAEKMALAEEAPVTEDTDAEMPAEAGDIYLTAFKDKSLLLGSGSGDEGDTEGIAIIAPVNKGISSGFVFAGYDNGFVSKVEWDAFLNSHTPGEKMQAALQPDGALMMLEVSAQEGFIGIVSEKGGKIYLKVFPTDNILIRDTLSGKGYNILQADYDKILAMVFIPAEYADKMARVIYHSRTPLGKDAAKFPEELALLHRLSLQ